MKYILNLSNTFVSDVDNAGQRAVDLAELSRNHVKIPLCFVVNEQALEAFVEHNRIKEKGAQFLGEGNYHGLQDEIISSSLPGTLMNELKEAYGTLAISEKDGAETIVSSTSEPFVNVILSPNYRTNGEIVLGAKGLQELANAIKQVWAMLFSQESFEEREELGVKEFFSGIIIQRAPQSRASADVIANNTPNVVVETYFGYPDLSNKFVKDYFEISKENLQIVKHEVKHQNQGLAKDETGKLAIVNMAGKGSHQKVDDKIVTELGRLGKKINMQLKESITASFTIDKAIYLLSVDRVPDVVVEEPDADIIQAADEELAMEDVDPIMETDDELIPELDDDREESIMPEQEEEFLSELEKTKTDEVPEQNFESTEFDRSAGDSFESPEETIKETFPEEPQSFEEPVDEEPSEKFEIPELPSEPEQPDEAVFDEPEHLPEPELPNEPEISPEEIPETPSEPEFTFDEPSKPEQPAVEEAPAEFEEPVASEKPEETPSLEVPELPTGPEKLMEVPTDFDDSTPESLPDSFDEPEEKLPSPWKEEVEQIDEKIAQVGEIKDMIHDLENLAKSGDEAELQHKITELHDAVARLKYQS